MLVPVPCSVGNVKLLTLTPSSLFYKFKEDENEADIFVWKEFGNIEPGAVVSRSWRGRGIVTV